MSPQNSLDLKKTEVTNEKERTALQRSQIKSSEEAVKCSGLFIFFVA